MKKLILALSVVSFSISAFAADAVGKYNGKLNLDISGVVKMIKTKAASGTPEQKKQAESMVTMIETQIKAMNDSIIKLELKKDGTLTMSQTTGKKAENETGKWSQKGNVIKFTNLSSKTGPKELTGTISKDGKTLFFDLSDEIKKSSAKSGAPAPKGSLTFKKA